MGLLRSARKSAATVELLRRIRDKSTGRLSVGAGASRVSVFVWQGEILGSEAADDARQHVRLLGMRGAIPPELVEALEAQIENAHPVFERVLEAAPPEALDDVLDDRFQQNLAAYLGSIGQVEFQPLPAIFLDTIHMGTNAARLIDHCCGIADAANSLDLDAVVAVGPGTTRTPEQQLVSSELSDGPMRVSLLLYAIPLEPLMARAVVIEMLQAGSVIVPDDDAEDAELEDLATEFEEADTGPANAPEDIDTLVDDVDEKEDAEPMEEEDEDSPVEAGGKATGAGNLSSLAAWMEAASAVDDEELDAFTDNDYVRGDQEEGAFSTHAHNLDKVEVADSVPAQEAKPPAPTSKRYSAPVLSEADALGKIEVANEVLTTVAQAFDDAAGPGRGRAALQLLVDGSPARFSAILADLSLDDAGRLPDASVLDNLYARPESEHRQLLNQTLSNLIERALSSAADELPDETFDTLLESVAGYGQRLGR